MARLKRENAELRRANEILKGVAVARCTVERLMRELVLSGAVRSRRVRTTIRDDGHERARDLLRRDFTAPSPNRRWVADFAYVATWDGIVYVAFVVDIYSRATVGWSAATNKRTQFVLNAVETAQWRRNRDGRPVGKGLIHHSDAGSQGEFSRSSQRPVEGSLILGCGSSRCCRGLHWVIDGAGFRSLLGAGVWGSIPGVASVSTKCPCHPRGCSRAGAAPV